MAETETEQRPLSLTREDGGVALIHINRPPANSYNRVFIDTLNQLVDEIRFDDSIKGVVLVSDIPKFFCAGADINMFRDTSPRQRSMIILHMHEVLQKVERTPKVFVAAISGHALGGGLEIALACDLRFAAEGEYRIGLPEVTLGLLPGNGGTQRLQRLIGRGRALEMMVTGDPVGPQRAAELGIVERVVPAEKLHDECVSYVKRLAGGATFAIGNIKISAKQGAELPLDGALAFERESLWGVFASEDAEEGLTAFKEKRAANWKGR
ncbi:MAG TPA: enoyl-CoA hydratase/isomerase family protein [Chloroflexota bacterium]|nr:enoyl-CoA hydratase/isomerase family protein [Chloroflexota bacterium]